MSNEFFHRILRKRFLIVTALFFLLPALSFAEGTVTAVTGAPVAKKGEVWRLMKVGERLEEGTEILFGTSSSVVVKVGDGEFELTAGPEGRYVIIIKLGPPEVEVRGGIVRKIERPPQPPAAPALLSPSDGIRIREAKVSLEWSPSEGGEGYHLQVSQTQDFKKMVLDENVRNTIKAVEGIGAGMYYWRASAINRNGIEGGFSEVRSFEIRPLPEPPSLAPPASTKTSTTFRWKRRSEEERFHLQISKNRDFSDTAVDLKYIEGPRVTVGMLEEGDYFVRVSAVDEEGFEGRFSDPIPFYVGPKVPSSNIGPIMIMFGVAFMLLGL